MPLWVDPPAWPAHGRLWAHLVSDRSLDELHAFAAAQGLPRRGFERDHYDVPAELYEQVVRAGATPVQAKELLARLTASGLRRRKRDAMARRSAGRPLLRPPRLRSGDLVAVPAPAGPVPPERLRAGVAVLESWGLRVRVSPHTLARHPSLGYLAGDDAERAADFTAAWSDDEVAAVVCARGGYGAQRILDLLDWRGLAEGRPKILLGFSDVTALHQAVASQLGLVTIHGHVATSLGGSTPESRERLRLMLFEPTVVDLLEEAAHEVVLPGSAAGVLVGGNLTMIATGLGGRHAHGATDSIVVFEDVSEEPYRLDRSLTQLLRAGWFDGVRAIVLGEFTDCGDPDQTQRTLRDRLVPLGVPIVSGVDLGHTSSTRTVPLGVVAELAAPSSGPARLTLAQPPLA